MPTCTIVLPIELNVSVYVCGMTRVSLYSLLVCRTVETSAYKMLILAADIVRTDRHQLLKQSAY